jgi:hypothetical protein
MSQMQVVYKRMTIILLNWKITLQEHFCHRFLSPQTQTRILDNNKKVIGNTWLKEECLPDLDLLH